MSKLKRANEYIKNNQFENALQLFFDVIEEDPNNPIGYINAGNLLTVVNKESEAERFFLRAIEKDKDAATAYIGLGNLYYDQGFFDKAEKLLQHAITLQIDDVDTYYLLGMTHVKRNQLILALPFLQRSVELGATVEQTFQYGLILAQLDYVDEAEEVFQTLLQREPTYADALYNLAIIYLQRDENTQEAMRYLTDTLRIEPAHTLALHAKEQLDKGKE